jgi:hypothetical protein
MHTLNSSPHPNCSCTKRLQQPLLNFPHIPDVLIKHACFLIAAELAYQNTKSAYILGRETCTSSL